VGERESTKDKLEREAKLRGRRGARASLALREARRAGCHSVPGVEQEPRQPLRPSGGGNVDAISRALRSFS
jgi:hypothetical protein